MRRTSLLTRASTAVLHDTVAPEHALVNTRIWKVKMATVEEIVTN
jgi:hypothetical protein